MAGLVLVSCMAYLRRRCSRRSVWSAGGYAIFLFPQDSGHIRGNAKCTGDASLLCFVPPLETQFQSVRVQVIDRGQADGILPHLSPPPAEDAHSLPLRLSPPCEGQQRHDEHWWHPRGRRFKSSRPDHNIRKKRPDSFGGSAFRVSGMLPEVGRDEWLTQNGLE